jgi:hypothetical protein
MPSRRGVVAFAGCAHCVLLLGTWVPVAGDGPRAARGAGCAWGASDAAICRVLQRAAPELIVERGADKGGEYMRYSLMMNRSRGPAPLSVKRNQL